MAATTSTQTTTGRRSTTAATPTGTAITEKEFGRRTETRMQAQKTTSTFAIFAINRDITQMPVRIGTSDDGIATKTDGIRGEFDRPETAPASPQKKLQ